MSDDTEDGRGMVSIRTMEIATAIVIIAFAAVVMIEQL